MKNGTGTEILVKKWMMKDPRCCGDDLINADEFFLYV